MSSAYSWDEPSHKIKSKRNKLGGKNPRYVSACNEEAFKAMLHADMQGNYRHLTKKEIAAQYPPEKVESLITKATQNLKDINDVRIPPSWVD